MRNGVFFALVLANVFVWSTPLPGGLSVSFLDVGEGDAVFIQSPTGASVLIDGGPSGGAVLRGIGERLPFFDRSLDAVIETSPSASYATGLASVFERYTVKKFLTPSFTGDTKTAGIVVRAAEDSGAEHAVLSRGMRVLLGSGVYLDVLSPRADAVRDATTGALVLRLVYGKTSFLLTSAALQKTELALVAADGARLESDVLKPGGHGSKNASALAFVAAVSPRYVIFSRGCNNQYEHPAPEVVARFQNLGAKIFDTCEDETTTFISNGTYFVARR